MPHRPSSGAPEPTPVEALLERLHRLVPRGALLGLERTRAALGRLGDPHLGLPALHVAGTNGKGSVAAMLESILRVAGHRTGLFTSPHLCRFAERIRLDGEPLDDARLASALARALDAGDELTFFEVTTLAAFLAFAEAGVTPVLEVGLGGRLDATNVCAPIVTVITSIALDHVERLGPTVRDVAREKAGVVKPGVPLVLGPLEPEAEATILDIARKQGAPALRVAPSGDGYVVVGDLPAPSPASAPLAGGVLLPRGPVIALSPPLEGRHQRANAAVAAVAAQLALSHLGPSPGCSASDSARLIEAGIAGTRWPGRMERITRHGIRHVLDCAHNAHGAVALARALAEARPEIPPHRTALVFGAMADKDWRAMLRELGALAAHRVYVAPPGRQAASPDELSRELSGAIAPSVPAALAAARTRVGGGGRVVIAGSIFLVGAARADLLGLPCDPVVAL